MLADAIDCPAEQRGALLDVRCAGDPSLRQEVESLLIASRTRGRRRPVDARPEASAARWVRKPVTEWSGRRVAQYLVQDSIGSAAWRLSTGHETSGSDVRSP